MNKFLTKRHNYDDKNQNRVSLFLWLSYTSTRTCFSSRLIVLPWCKPGFAGCEVEHKQHVAKE